MTMKKNNISYESFRSDESDESNELYSSDSSNDSYNSDSSNKSYGYDFGGQKTLNILIKIRMEPIAHVHDLYYELLNESNGVGMKKRNELVNKFSKIDIKLPKTYIATCDKYYLWYSVFDAFGKYGYVIYDYFLHIGKRQNIIYNEYLTRNQCNQKFTGELQNTLWKIHGKDINDNTCIICHESKEHMIILPCYHILCKGCFRQYKKETYKCKCPYCRTICEYNILPDY